LRIEVRTASGYASVISLISFLFIVEAIGILKPPVPRALPLLPTNGTLSLSSGFKSDAVYTSTDRTNVPAGVNLYGSWLGSDNSTGSASTAWYAATPKFLLMVAGYPNNPNLMLAVQTQDAQGHVQTSPITSANPQEAWAMVSVTLPNAETAKYFRIIANDNSTASRGWLGFSEPFKLDIGESTPTLSTAGIASMYAAAVLSLLVGILCGLAAWSKRLFPSHE